MFAVMVNNIPVPAVPIHNVTYVEAAPAGKALGVNYQVVGDLYATPFEQVKGKLINNQLYIPWNEVGRHIKAIRVPGYSWKFEEHDNVIAATPFGMTYAYQVLFGLNNVPFQLDTGAFETYLEPDAAIQLGVIPDGNTYQVGGIGGVTTAWEGIIPQLQWGDTVFRNVPCVVNPNWTGPNLFGWRFFQDNGYSLDIDRPNFTLNVIKN